MDPGFDYREALFGIGGLLDALWGPGLCSLEPSGGSMFWQPGSLTWFDTNSCQRYPKMRRREVATKETFSSALIHLVRTKNENDKF